MCASVSQRESVESHEPHPYSSRDFATISPGRSPDVTPKFQSETTSRCTTRGARGTRCRRKPTRPALARHTAARTSQPGAQTGVPRARQVRPAPWLPRRVLVARQERTHPPIDPPTYPQVRRATNAGGRTGRDEHAMNVRERARSVRPLCTRLLGGERRPCRLWSIGAAAQPHWLLLARPRSAGRRCAAGARLGRQHPIRACPEAPLGCRGSVLLADRGCFLGGTAPSDSPAPTPTRRAAALAEQEPVADPTTRD